SEVQIKMMEGFPVREYHFLILILPYKFYHGVEHTNSTVLALGPGSALMNEPLYTDLLGVASHELFHAWNVKTIRPADMLPYKYQEENYSRLGWVYEGITTYYGDLFLARSGFFTISSYFEEVNARLQKHFDNYGRFNLSVADSSFDTWLDGYVPGIPNRKTSIYDEGCLIALMLDLFIRKNSSWKYSLDDVMKSLYKDFALQNLGYRENDIRLLTEHFSGTDASAIFNNYINGTELYIPFLQELLAEVGCYISITLSKNYFENMFGFRVAPSAAGFIVSAVAPGSPAETAGLCKDDEVIAVNNYKAEGNLNDLFTLFKDEEITLDVFEMKKKKTIQLKPTGESFYSIYKIGVIDECSSESKENFGKWTGIIIK
ncbi:MAG: PDZ domain-containing protein, partial [Bacteroidota bacterium]